MDLLEKWVEADAQLKEAKATEIILRKALSREMFGEYPTEGTHKKDGVKLTQKYNKKITDLDGLLLHKEEAVQAKYTLIAKEYDPSCDQFLELKPSAPSLKIEGGE